MATSSSNLRDVGLLFLKLGVLGFGGPAAHIALMEEEVVRRRDWLSREEFLDLVGVVNLLPGPNSTELAIAIGRRRAGTSGLLVAGAAFILPAAVIVLALAWGYVRYGHNPDVEGLWRGIKPVVVAVVAVALVRFGATAIKSFELGFVAIVAIALTAVGVHELLVLLASGLAAMALASRHRAGSTAALVLPWLVWADPGTGGAGSGWLFLFFLKTGAVLYGSGYVLLSFLRSGLVERGWLTESQLLDAVAIGQVTPGPVFTTATFVGYLLAGWTGALSATLGIFLPAFLLVAVSDPLIRRIGRSPALRALLDGVNVGALALMAVVTWQLGRSAVDSATTAIMGLAALVLLGLGLNSAVLVAAGALAGLILF
ncbi:MAG TPA: chromate efflux transporter [Gemmatimonadales bacterium]